jgi:hypothetical protein
MAYRLCPKVVFINKKVFVDDVLSKLVEKTMLTYVHPTFANCISTTCTFDLWMSKGAHDVFVVVINFVSNKWEAKHIIIKLFEVSNFSGVAMVPRLQQLLDKFFFTQKILAYVKDEGSNIQTYANALNYVISCVNLAMMEPFVGSCFGHALSKVCHYPITNEKVAQGLSYASIKTTPGNIWKCIT